MIVPLETVYFDGGPELKMQRRRNSRIILCILIVAVSICLALTAVLLYHFVKLGNYFSVEVCYESTTGVSRIQVIRNADLDAVLTPQTTSSRRQSSSSWPRGGGQRGRGPKSLTEECSDHTIYPGEITQKLSIALLFIVALLLVSLTYGYVYLVRNQSSLSSSGRQMENKKNAAKLKFIVRRQTTKKQLNPSSIPPLSQSSPVFP